MNADLISSVLESHGGYRLASQPLRIHDIDFSGDFDAVLQGPDDERGLVLVLDATSLSLWTIQRRLTAVLSALTRTGSMRPVTVVLITTGDLEYSTAADFGALCRVIVIPAESNPHERLRTLLRLRLKLPGEQAVETADAVLREELGDGVTDPFVNALIEAARKGRSEVERIVREQIDRVAESPMREGERP